MVMVLSALLKLKSRQVDYTQTFHDVFMKIPQGWHYDSSAKKLIQNINDPHSVDKEHFIHLKCNLYGVKEAARNWYLHLQKGLL
jgi:hypothetical protein